MPDLLGRLVTYCQRQQTFILWGIIHAAEPVIIN